MTSQLKVASNRRNSKLSTGPSEAGKERTRFNGLKHGMRSRTQVLPGEDPLAFDAVREYWVVTLKPGDLAELNLVNDIVNACWLQQRAELAFFEHTSARIEQHAELEQERVEDDVRRLFWDACGPHCMYGISSAACGGPTTSALKTPDDPNHPSKVVRRLESSEKGCQSLIGYWQMLRGRLEGGLDWQGQDRLKCVRMLGKQPLDALEDQQIWLVFAGSFALHPKGKDPFQDLKSEMGTVEFTSFLDRVLSRWPLLLDASDTPKARQTMFDLVDRNLERLEAKVEVHRQLAAGRAGKLAAGLGSDHSKEGQQLTRFETASVRRKQRCLDAFWRYRREMRRAEAEEREIFEEGGDELEAENFADSSTESGVATVESTAEKNLTTEAKPGLTPSQAEVCKGLLSTGGKIQDLMSKLSRLSERGMGGVGTLVEGGGMELSAIDAAILGLEPLPGQKT